MNLPTINISKGTRNVAIWILIALAVLALTFLAGMKHEETRIKNSPTKTITHTYYQQLPAPPPIIKWLPAPIPKDTSNKREADSLLAAKQKESADSVKALVESLSAPKSVVFKYDSCAVDSAKVSSDPLPLPGKLGLTLYFAKPTREIDSTFTEHTVFKADATWRVVGVAAILAVVIETAAVILRK